MRKLPLLAIIASCLVMNSATARSDGGAPSPCEILAKQGLLGTLIPPTRLAWDGLKLALDRRRFARVKWEGAPSSPSEASPSPMRIVVLSMLKDTSNAAKPDGKIIQRELRDAMDIRVLKLMKAKSLAQCSARAEKLGVSADDVRATFEKLQDARADGVEWASATTDAQIDKFAAWADNHPAPGVTIEVRKEVRPQGVLDFLRSDQGPTAIIVVGHAESSGRIVDADGVPLPVNILREKSASVRAVAFVACDGPATEKTYLPSEWSTHPQTRAAFGYVETGKFAGLEVGLSTTTVALMLKDIRDDLMKNPAWFSANADSSEPVSDACHLAHEAITGGPVASFYSSHLLAIDNAALGEHEFPCRLLDSHDGRPSLILTPLIDATAGSPAIAAPERLEVRDRGETPVAEFALVPGSRPATYRKQP